MSGDRPRRRNLDLIEHLDNPDCLIEVNVQTGVDPHVQVLFTDMDGTAGDLRFDKDEAYALSRIIALFDRRGLRELGLTLAEAVHEITAEETGQ